MLSHIGDDAIVIQTPNPPMLETSEINPLNQVWLNMDSKSPVLEDLGDRREACHVMK